MNLILLQASELSNDKKSAVLGPKDAKTKHILKHLKKKNGESVRVGVLGGKSGQALVHEEESGNLRLTFQGEEWEECGEVANKMAPQVTLILALPYPRRIKSLWPMIASMGFVTRIIIVRSELSDLAHCATSSIRPEVFEPLILEGLSQGAHTARVNVDVHVSVPLSRDLITTLNLEDKEGARVFLDCGDEDNLPPPPARDIILSRCQSTPHAVLAFGPERGWTDAEANLFRNEGFESASLGSSILRVDTAVIAGLGIVGAALDECIAAKSSRKRLIEDCEEK